MCTQLRHKRRKAGWTTAFDVQIDSVKYSRAERTRRARTAEEQVPDGVRESFPLGVRAEGRRTARPTERECDDLARCLAALDTSSQKLAIGQPSARENATVGTVADLLRPRRQ